MEVWVAKVIAIAISFVLPFVCNMIPWPMAGFIQSKGKLGERIICYLMCFGGGIFFGTYLLHISPECRDVMDEFLLHPNGVEYPVTDLIIGCGFLVTLFLEKAVMRVNKRRNQAKKRRQQNKLDDDGGNTNVAYRAQRRDSSEFVCKEECDSCTVGKPCEGLDEGGSVTFTVTPSTNSLQDLIVTTATDVNLHMVVSESNNNNQGPVHDKELGLAFDKPPSMEPTSKSSSASNIDKVHDADDVSSSSDEDDHHNTRSLILILALSMHHLFEGLSLGLQFTVSRVFTLLLALMCHETIICFSLGLQFIKCHYSLRRFVITAFVSCCVTPVGVAIGTILSEVGGNGTEIEIVNGVLQSFAAGTFIFVTFFEILQEEIDPHDTSMGKVCAVAAGYTAIALLMLVPEDTSTGAPIDTNKTSIIEAVTVGSLFNGYA